MEEKKVFSILGDSISTFAGYTPTEAVFYDAWTKKEAGVFQPEDTWWMQVIKGAGGVLGVNNSYAGSLVSGHMATSGTSEQRIAALGKKGEPDVILVAMGMNDWAFSVLPEEFEFEYRKMIQRLKEYYPESKICCATLLRGCLDDSHDELFFNAEGCISQKIYSDIIRRVVKESEVYLADLGKYGMEYKTIDGVHPTKEGMDTLVDLWLKEMSQRRLS